MSHDSDVNAQAEELANRTPVSEAEARAYIVWKRAEDGVNQRELARRVGVGESAFSQQLNAAQEVFGSEAGILPGDVGVDTFARMVLIGAAGGPNTELYQVIDGATTSSAVAVMTEYGFDSSETISYQYRLHLLVRDTPDGEFMDGMPANMHLPERWQVYNVGGETITELSVYAEAALEEVGVSGRDQAGVMEMFGDNGADVSGWAATLLDEV